MALLGDGPCERCGSLIGSDGSGGGFFGYCSYECFRQSLRGLASTAKYPTDPRCKVCREPIRQEGHLQSLAAGGFCSSLCMSTWRLRESRKVTQAMKQVTYPSDFDNVTLSIQEFSFSTVLRMRSPAGFAREPIYTMKQHELKRAGLWKLLK